MVRYLQPAVLAAALTLGATSIVSAHTFLDHAIPAVGSSLPTAPTSVTIWFTQALEPAFSGITVTDAAGRRVDLGSVQIVPGHPDELQVGLKPVSAGTYRVNWHVVSVDTHPTQGNFTFTVGR